MVWVTLKIYLCNVTIIEKWEIKLAWQGLELEKIEKIKKKQGLEWHLSKGSYIDLKISWKDSW